MVTFGERGITVIRRYRISPAIPQLNIIYIIRSRDELSDVVPGRHPVLSEGGVPIEGPGCDSDVRAAPDLLNAHLDLASVGRIRVQHLEHALVQLDRGLGVTLIAADARGGR